MGDREDEVDDDFRKLKSAECFDACAEFVGLLAEPDAKAGPDQNRGQNQDSEERGEDTFHECLG